MKTTKLSVAANGCEGVWYTDGAPKKRCMIVNITFGGGSIFVKSLAKWLIVNNCDALGLTISGSKQTGKNQSEIPVEYVESAVQYLKDQGYEKIGIMGLSLGSSMSMLAASLIPDLSLVISLSGFDRVFEGVLGMGTQYPSGHSSFTWRGNEIPFQPFYLNKEEYLAAMKKAKEEHGEAYGRMLWDDSMAKEVNEDAVIPVENIHGSILMLGSATDTCWDTAGAAERIEARLKEKGSEAQIKVKTYEHGVHFILPDNVPLISLMCRMAFKEWKIHNAECKATRVDVRKQIEAQLRNWA